MSAERNFTHQQQALIDATTSTYVEACPGAGKTQSIVQRFLMRSGDDPRRGIALLSFTNAAVDEARARSMGNPGLLRPPNYIGTIDGFINRFVVGPVFVSRKKLAPRFRSTWQQVPGSTITAPGVRGQFPMDWFRFGPLGDAVLDESKVPAERRFSVADIDVEQRARLAGEAKARWLRHLARGVMDSATARLMLRTYLGDPHLRDTVGQILAGRFFEVIVDEVQDCCDEDVELLKLLREVGVRLVVVGDPEQAIYGFRGASSSELSGLYRSLSGGPRLNGNFRSSPVICSVVNSLRSGDSVDEPVGPNREVSHPLLVLEFSREASVKTAVDALLAELGCASNDAIVLAHATSKARQSAGGGGGGKLSDNKLCSLAHAVQLIQDERGSGRSRAEGLEELERILWQLSPSATEDVGFEEHLTALSLSRRAYREHCLRLAMAVKAPFEGPPSAFKADVSSRSASQEVVSWSPSGLRVPNGDKWPSRPVDSSGALRYSTVHGFKGLQSRAVVMVLSEKKAGAPTLDDGVTCWSSGTASEARNVLYVGVSRAEELLILAVHSSILAEVRANLDRDAVAYELRTA